jgi:hypothetical protein
MMQSFWLNILVQYIHATLLIIEPGSCLIIDGSGDQSGLPSINQLEKAAASCLILMKIFAAEYAKAGCHFDLNFNIWT